MSAEQIAPDLDLYTVDDFYSLIRDGQKADLIDGVIYMASPDTRRNDDLTHFIHFLLRRFARARGLGEVTGSRYAYILSPHRAPEPDVALVTAERLNILQEKGGVGAPDIAVEIVSRDSRSRDYDEKLRLYEQAGVREYWIIDPLQQRASFFRHSASGYVLVPLTKNRIFHSEVLPGFWLDVDWFFTRPLPDEDECVRDMLAGPPE